jgi:YD repeat-containing protein
MTLSPADFYSGGGYSVSDSPVRLLPPADFGAAPAPEPVTFYQPQSGRVNVALAANGGYATASSTYNQPPNWVYSAAGTIDGNRRGSSLGGGQWSGWNDDAPGNTFPDYLQVDFNGHKTIDEIDLFTQQDAYANPSEPTEAMTFSQYGLTGFTVEYRTAAGWATVPGGTVSGNDKVWRKLTFPAVTTDAIRVQTSTSADGYSRVTELEAWGTSAARFNLALASNGGVASASSSLNSPPWVFTPAGANDGDRRGANWGSGGGWNDAGPAWNMQSNEVWLEVAFPGLKSIDEVDVFTNQDAYANPLEPTEAMTFSQYGLTAYEVQYWTGAGWANVPGGSVTGNDKVWRRFTFPALTTSRVRVLAKASPDGYSRLAEVEAYEAGAPQTPAGTGLTGEYYDGVNFDTYRLTRSDATINFDWVGSSPHPSVGADNFSVRWTGTVVPRYTESYTFHTTTDDGVRLWIDGQLVIDRWQDQAPSEEDSDPIALEAGRHYAVRLEYYERGGGALAWLKWSSASQAKEVVPQARLYGCWKGADQFVKDFYQGAMGRQPTAAELQDRAGRLNQASGDSQLLAEAQGLGALLFTSAEYAARNRTDQQYVTDLYLGYLQRAPDSGGLNHWTNEIAGCGSNQQCRQVKRADVRAAFDQSLEFGEKVRNLCGTSAGSPGTGRAGYNFTAARLDPVNRTGGGGMDAYSRNFNFSIPLVSLPGRAGLDLGLTLSYNSLVWTKDAGGVTFDADQGFPSPGFRLGFPTVEPKFVNPLIQQAGQPVRYSYLLVTPGGARVELRQTATAGVYESADSSYLQLVEGGGGPQTLLATDGTQLSFVLLNGAYRCHQVKDRNGNYLTVSHYGDGRIWKVTDTLGRVVTFNYDNYQNLTSITQPWTREGEPGVTPVPSPDEAHEWATFGYESRSLQPQFSNLAVVGDQPGTVFPAVNQVGLADGSFYRFAYNQWGQVWKVTHYAADSLGANGQPDESHPLSSTRIDLPGAGASQGGAAAVAATPQADCPRFKEERSWVEYGVRNQSGEVAVSYDTWAADMASCEVTLPDNTTKQVSNYYTSADEWKKGLTASEVTISGGQTVRTTTLTWEHDGGAGAAYSTNPRVTRTTVSDPQQHTRTTRVTYTVPADFQGESGYTGTLNLSLPKKVEECADSNCTAAKRTTVTDYKVPNLGQYVARRILGLARRQYLYDGPESVVNLRARVENLYDEANNPQDTFLAALPSPSPTASQHDGANYGQSMTWRGNANRVRRYSVDQSNGTVGSYVETRLSYNVTGTVAYAKDTLGHKSSFSYTDSFYLNINRTHPDPQYRLQTYAYPTTVTDPDNFTASTAYNYDLGVVTEARTPKPNVTLNEPGPLSRRYYDAAGRLVRSSSDASGASTRVVYPAKMDVVESFTLIEAGKESRVTRVLDGTGRTRHSARYLPPLSDDGTGTYAGNYSGQRFDYDEMGRLARRSNPAEVTASWAFAGEDSAWVYTLQSYDWKGRPLTTTNADGTTVEYKYGGCGCAGGEVVTVRDEVGRRQRVTYDVLGRALKTQVLTTQPKTEELSEGVDADVYSTATNTYDAFDHVLQVAEQAGVSGSSQITTMSYDGYGRLSTRHLPAQDTNRLTAWTYNGDGAVETVTDARGVKVTYGYNSRHLVTSVAYDTSGVIAGQNVATASNVTLAYDAAGNREQMQDGYGTVTYQYDLLSRLTSESRHFTDAGDGSVNFTRGLSYEYNLAGELASLTDPAGLKFLYAYDRAGQLTGVTGATSYGNVTDYASAMQYRAWGALKAMGYGNGRSLSATYNARLQVESFQVPGVMGSQYRYTTAAGGSDNDGRVKFVQDLTQANSPFDRSYAYDLAGRLTQAKTGSGARGSAFSSGPYHESFVYDEWNHTTSRIGKHWTQSMTAHAATYTNDRASNVTHDADGRPRITGTLENTYDAAGMMASATDTAARERFAAGLTVAHGHDGDGRRIRHAENGYRTYYVRSSVLGEVVAEYNAAGQWQRGYVYGPGVGLVATRAYATSQYVEWEHADPVTGNRRRTDTSGAEVAEAVEELDPLGVEMGRCNPYFGGCGSLEDLGGKGGLLSQSRYGNAPDRRAGCNINGMMVMCDMAQAFVDSGAAAECPEGVCQGSVYSNSRKSYVGFVQWDPNAATAGVGISSQTGAIVRNSSNSGWITVGANFVGNGITAPSLTGAMEFVPLRNLPDESGYDYVDVKSEPQDSTRNTIADDIKAMLTNPDSGCGTYVSSLIEEVARLTDRTAKSTDGVKIVEMIVSQGNYLIKPLDRIGGTINGSLLGKNASVVISPNSDPNRNLRMYYADVGLHETIHHASGIGRESGGYNDVRLAQAAFNLMSAGRQALFPLPQRAAFPDTDEGTFQYILARSDYWDRELYNNCPPVVRKK